VTFFLSMERRIGEKPELHGFHLGTVERIARTIVEEKMQCCRENGWPMITMGLLRDGKVRDVLYRCGKWHSQLDVDLVPEWKGE
jgi:hypothetical protein